MSLARFEPAVPAGQQPQTYALEHAVTGIGYLITEDTYFIKNVGRYIVHCLLIVLVLLMFFVHCVVTVNL
jgi:hypothetical protein